MSMKVDTKSEREKRLKRVKALKSELQTHAFELYEQGEREVSKVLKAAARELDSPGLFKAQEDAGLDGT